MIICKREVYKNLFFIGLILQDHVEGPTMPEEGRDLNGSPVASAVFVHTLNLVVR